MKIIFSVNYISRRNTGISSVVENLTINLHNEGHKIFIAAIEDEYSQIDKVKFSDAEILLIKGGTNLYKIFRLYLKFFINSNADIAHIHSLWSISSLAIFYWAYLTKKPYFISPNGMMNEWALNQSKLKKRLFLKAIFKKIINKAESIIINSQAEKNYLMKNGWHTNFHVIPNGVNMPGLEMKVPKKNLAKKKLLFLSRIHKKKGIEILLDAWHDLFPITMQNNWELAIVGFMDIKKSGFEKYISDKITSDPNLSNVIMSNGKFDGEMWEEYNSSDAFILPTFSEGSAMVVLNAWTTGKICLTTVESNLEKGLDESCTILIETNIESIKAGILKLIHLNNNQLTEYGHFGRKIIEDNYTWKKIVEQYIIIYEKSYISLSNNLS